MKRKTQIFAKRVRKRLVDLNMTVTDIATAIGHPRSTVSQCIHTPRFPKVRSKMRQAINL